MRRKNKKPKLIHIVGGGFNQVPLVNMARSMGLTVLVTDMNANPAAKKHADHYEQINTIDKTSTLRCAKKYKIDYITTDQTDVAVPTVAYVAEKLGLKGIGYHSALKFTNKHLMRDALKGKLDEHIPKNYYFDCKNEALKFCKAQKAPSQYLVKPVDSQGSKGVSMLNHSYQPLIESAFHESMNKGIIIEVFISGSEFSVESFVKDGKVHNLALTRKYHYSTSPCLDERNTFLGDIDLALEKKIFDLNTKVINALGLPFGSTHAEYKVERGKIYLIEIAARGAGGSISSNTIPFLTGFDPSSALLKTLTKQSFDIKIDDYKKKFAVLKFFNFTPGRVKEIVANKTLIDNATVFVLDVKKGDEIRHIKDSRDRLGYFVIHGTNRQHVLQRERMVESAIQIEYY